MANVDPEVQKLRETIAQLYRKTYMTQEQIAKMLNIPPSRVNTAISMLIPAGERAKLVSRRKTLARLNAAQRIKTCPHCGGDLVKDAHPHGVPGSQVQTQAPITEQTEDVQPQYVQTTLAL